MIKTLPASNIFKTQDAKQITFVSIVALLLGHLMLNTYIPIEIVNLIGLFITSYYIYDKTLRKNDFFSFVMVIYFCSTFPYLRAKGGGFNLVSFICVGLYLSLKKRLPKEKIIKNLKYKLLIGLFVLSSILGWLGNFTGTELDIVYSVMTFLGVIAMLLSASSLEITPERIKVFIQLNIVLIIWSTIASVNKYLHISTFKTPLMPIYGLEKSFFEGGGLIGSSPLYGEHSLILLMLFAVFLILARQKIGIKRSTILIATMIAYINVFMSISRSVFLLSIVGLILILLFQTKINKIQIGRIFQQIILVLIFAFTVFYFVKVTGLDFVFERVEEIEGKNVEAGGVTIERILDGSAFNRETAFEIAKKRYASKDSWLIGYGWGLDKNNRYAYFVNPKIPRASPHSQIFSILFLFGWIGSIAYWGIIIFIIFNARKVIYNKKNDYLKRIMACFFMISFILFTFNEIKVESVFIPSYFTVTIIWMGLAFSVFNSTNKNQIFSLK